VRDRRFLPAAVLHVLGVSGGGDLAVAGVAAAQEGVVHRSQLLGAGLSREAVRHRVRAGRLFVQLPGVYGVGQPALQPLGAEVAALLYVGEDCVLSHRSAVAVRGLVAGSRLVEVTVIGRHVRERPGLRVHRTGRLDVRDVQLYRGLPVTAPARALIDFASCSTDVELERVLAEFRVQGLVTDRNLEAAMERCPGRAGVGCLKALMADEVGAAITKSGGERRLLRLIGASNLPRPESNVWVLGYEVDLVWRAAKLVVEVDGGRFHGHQRSFERDRRRDQVLVAAGYRVMRITGRQLKREPLAVLARIAQALGAAAAQLS
jgi:very-short-patch-repair endonuclease